MTYIEGKSMAEGSTFLLIVVAVVSEIWDTKSTMSRKCIEEHHATDNMYSRILQSLSVLKLEGASTMSIITLAILAFVTR